MNPEFGVTYYRLIFADPKFSMPGLEPMVYVGTNIYDESGKETHHYFQDTVSVTRFGILGKGEDVDLSPDINTITLEQSVNEIEQAYKNYIAEGKPKLKKAKEKWITIENS